MSEKGQKRRFGDVREQVRFDALRGPNSIGVRRHPVATKRAVRAIAKATEFCASEPEQAARLVAAKGYQYEYALQTMKEISYARWRDYDPDDAIRFYALRLREAGMIKASPASLIAQFTDWRIFNDLKRELKS
jgi:NitT/TauT family transport system substrate-binding protein